MAEVKTKLTAVSVDAFLDGVAHAGRRAEGQALRTMMERVIGEPAVMWGPSINCFGRYYSRYASGHEGDKRTFQSILAARRYAVRRATNQFAVLVTAR